MGATASVRCARRNGTVYAIKRLHPHLFGIEESRALFDDEAQLGLRLRHPNIVPVLVSGEDEFGPYQVQEYAPGPTLAALLEAAPTLPAPIACRIVADVAEGLSFAHGLCDPDGSEIGLVHCDINPGNVIVTISGATRLIDFGVAWFRGAKSGRAVRGTPAYLSPEQARGEELSGASDLFSLGSVLYELLTGTKAFPGAEHMAIAAIGREQLPEISGLGAPGAVLRALLAPLSKRAKDAAHIAASLSAMAAARSEVLALLRKIAGRG
jgi:serine/threonine-protein kinase